MAVDAALHGQRLDKALGEHGPQAALLNNAPAGDSAQRAVEQQLAALFPGRCFVALRVYGSDFACKYGKFDDMICIERHDGSAVERGPVDEAESAREPVEEQVFGKAHPGKEVHLLEHHHHPRRLRGGSRTRRMGDRPKRHLPGVGWDESAENRGERRLPRAVGAHQNMDLAAAQVERHQVKHWRRPGL